MGTPYPLEKKNQILGRILSKEITVEQAHRCQATRKLTHQTTLKRTHPFQG